MKKILLLFGLVGLCSIGKAQQCFFNPKKEKEFLIMSNDKTKYYTYVSSFGGSFGELDAVFREDFIHSKYSDVLLGFKIIDESNVNVYRTGVPRFRLSKMEKRECLESEINIFNSLPF